MSETKKHTVLQTLKKHARDIEDLQKVVSLQFDKIEKLENDIQKILIQD